jgi:hypothetical protein
MKMEKEGETADYADGTDPRRSNRGPRALKRKREEKMTWMFQEFRSVLIRVIRG